MKIYFNERLIEFLPECPDHPVQTDLICNFSSVEELTIKWQEFLRYDRFRNFFIIDSKATLEFFTNGKTSEAEYLISGSSAFRSFMSLFKFVPAAGGLVTNEAGEYLFIHRFGLWDLPKGKISKKDFRLPALSDAAPRAALREVKEETGLTDVHLHEKLPCTWHIYSAKGNNYIKQTFWFRMTAMREQKLIPQTSEGIFLVKWTPRDNLHCVLAHTYRSIRELLVHILF